MSAEVVSKVKAAGVIGAGGAGFPTHVKLQPGKPIETVIANGAECEPLLQVDKAVMRQRADQVLRGIELVAGAVGASRQVIAIKRKYGDVLQAVERARSRHHQIEIHPLDNFYPAGDEQVLVNEVTGRVVPEGGIPLQVGAVVDNVVTLSWIAAAVDEGRPVTSRPLCVVGAVRRPVVLELPLGTPLRVALELAGGATVEQPAVLNGGPMMGAVARDLEVGIDKRTSALLVLPAEHKVIRRKLASMDYEFTLSKTACCQCRFCTDLCPRYMLGHGLEPHRAMRGINYLQDLAAAPSPDHTQAFICCQCGLCEVYACPLWLSPRKVYAELASQLRAKGVKNPHLAAVDHPRPSAVERRVPQPRLIARLGLAEYAHQQVEVDLAPRAVERVRIALRQGLGAACAPLVKVGDLVQAGTLLGSPPDQALGAAVHASIAGRVSAVTAESVELSVA